LTHSGRIDPRPFRLHYRRPDIPQLRALLPWAGGHPHVQGKRPHVFYRSATKAGSSWLEAKERFCAAPWSLDVEEWSRQIGEIRSIENLDAGIVLAVKRRYRRGTPRLLGIV